MQIDNWEGSICITVGNNDLFINKPHYWDWREWGLSNGGAFAIVTPLFTFYPWFSQIEMSQEAQDKLVADMHERIKVLKEKVNG